MAERAVSGRFPYITIKVRIAFLGLELETQALVDTGFDGGVMLPPLRLPRRPVVAERSFRLGDDSVFQLPSYPGEVEISGISGAVLVGVSIGAPEVIIGRGVIDRYRVTFDHGREVIVEP